MKLFWVIVIIAILEWQLVKIVIADLHSTSTISTVNQ
jgi:hypothetical protein